MNLKSLLNKYKINKQNKSSDPVVVTKLLAIRQQFFKSQQRHNFYLIPFSIWPFLVFFSILTTVIGFVMYLHSYIYGFFLFFFGFIFLVIVFFC